MISLCVAMPCGMWDLSSQTRDETHIPTVKAWYLNHWATREVPTGCISGQLREGCKLYTHTYSKKIACLLFVWPHIILENALETPQILQCTFWQQQKIKPSFTSEPSMGSLDHGMSSLLLQASRSWPHLSNADSSFLFQPRHILARDLLCAKLPISENTCPAWN